MKKIDHIGIACKSLKESIQVFKNILNIEPSDIETIPSEGVKVVFFEIGETKIELLEPINNESSIAKFITKRGEGVHHLAIKTEEISSDIIRLDAVNIDVIKGYPKKGAAGKTVCFLHPRNTNGVLFEYCQSPTTEDEG